MFLGATGDGKTISSAVELTFPQKYPKDLPEVCKTFEFLNSKHNTTNTNRQPVSLSAALNFYVLGIRQINILGHCPPMNLINIPFKYFGKEWKEYSIPPGCSSNTRK